MGLHFQAIILNVPKMRFYPVFCKKVNPSIIANNNIYPSLTSKFLFSALILPLRLVTIKTHGPC